MVGTLLLVGSIPLDTPQEVFETFGAPLGKYLFAVPDGEVGPRRHWISRVHYQVLAAHPELEVVQGPAPEGFNNPVHGVLVTNDDLVYVADRSNNRLQVFRLDGTFIKEIFISRNTLQNEGTVHGFAVSPDKEQKFLYIVDGSNKVV